MPEPEFNVNQVKVSRLIADKIEEIRLLKIRIDLIKTMLKNYVIYDGYSPDILYSHSELQSLELKIAQIEAELEKLNPDNSTTT